MKVVGMAGKNVLVSLTQSEFGAITGEGYYGPIVKDVFEKHLTPEVPIDSVIDNVLIVAKVPTQLKALRATVESTLKVVDGAITATADVQCLKYGKQPKK